MPASHSHNRSPAAVVAIAVLSLALLAPGCTSFRKMLIIAGSNPVSDPQAAAKRGASIYANHCVACHGTAGDGRGIAADAMPEGVVVANLGELAARKSVKTFAANIRYGKNSMPAFGDQFTDEQIWDVAYYAYSFAPDAK